MLRDRFALGASGGTPCHAASCAGADERTLGTHSLRLDPDPDPRTPEVLRAELRHAAAAHTFRPVGRRLEALVISTS